jgi:hypothetical protein
MIWKGGRRLSRKITIKQGDEIMIRFNLIGIMISFSECRTACAGRQSKIATAMGGPGPRGLLDFIAIRPIVGPRPRG